MQLFPQDTVQASSNVCRDCIEWEVPEDELRWGLEFLIDLCAKIFDLIPQEIDVLGDRFLRVIEFNLLILAEGVVFS